MKKVLLLLVVFSGLLFISCEGPEGPAGPPGYDGKNGKDGKDGYGSYWYVVKFTIQPNEWAVGGGIAGDLNTFYYVDKKIKELDNNVFDNGNVIAYIETDKGIKNGMPYVLHFGELTDNGGEHLWTQTYDYDFVVGSIRFYMTRSDFFTQREMKQPVTFHVVLMW